MMGLGSGVAGTALGGTAGGPGNAAGMMMGLGSGVAGTALGGTAAFGKLGGTHLLWAPDPALTRTPWTMKMMMLMEAAEVT